MLERAYNDETHTTGLGTGEESSIVAEAGGGCRQRSMPR